jgi:hypothetical protein
MANLAPNPKLVASQRGIRRVYRSLCTGEFACQLEVPDGIARYERCLQGVAQREVFGERGGASSPGFFEVLCTAISYPSLGAANSLQPRYITIHLLPGTEVIRTAARRLNRAIILLPKAISAGKAECEMGRTVCPAELMVSQIKESM